MTSIYTYLFLILVNLTSGCSMRKFAFEHHEFFSAQLATNYLDLDSKQKEEFKNQWRSFTNGIAESKLEELAAQIEGITQSTQPAVTTAMIQQQITEIMTDACSKFSATLAKLKPNQISRLKEKMSERNQKFDPEKQGGVQKLRKKQQKELTKNAETWIGTINQEQKQLLNEVELEKDPEGKWEQDYLVYSREAQDIFVGFITTHPGDSGSIQQKCRDYALNPDRFLSEKSRSIKAKLAEFRRKNLAIILQSLDPEQRQHLRRETSKLAKDLRAWAKLVRDNSRTL